MKKKILPLFFATIMILTVGCAKPKNEEKITGKVLGETGVYQSALGGYLLDEKSPNYVEIKETAATLYDIDALAGVDDLKRQLIDHSAAGDKNKREVAMFYCLWHDSNSGPFTFEEVLSKNPDPLKPPTSAPWLGVGPYYWGKPLYDYYKTNDTWVMRKHIELLTYAGVDYLVFDTTNNSSYVVQALKMMKLLDEYMKMGWNVPKVAFYTNTDSSKRMAEIYTGIYELNKYPDTWYMTDGKPLIIGHNSQASAMLKDFFTIRESQWPNEPDKAGGFPWIDFKEVPSVYADVNGKNKVISVSVAQNSSATSKFSDSYFYGDDGNRGRSYHNGAANITEDSYKHGYNFQAQWDNAIKSNADVAMVLEWNEWYAGAYNDSGTHPTRPIAVFDCITPEYSRDIEPMSGGYFDNYYMQLVNNIRKFKGLGKSVSQTEKNTIDIAGTFNQWTKVKETYRDFAFGNIRRDDVGVGDTRLINNTGRNGLVYSKITQDSKNLYFYVQATADITSYDKSEGTWMQLFLDFDGKKENDWLGYDYIVNYSAKSDNKTNVAKYGDGEFKEVGEVDYKISGNQMMISVPKSLLGIDSDTVNFEFKWADSREDYKSIEDFYSNGDVMPAARFNYKYSAK